MRWLTAEKMIKEGKFKTPIGLDGYPCEMTRLWKYQNIWSKEFKFNEQVMIKAKFRLMRAVDQWKQQNHFEAKSINPLIIMVHVRRTDYIKWLIRINGTVPDTSYFDAAFKYFTKK